ncbi:hypothetical protein B5X24_HaOG217281 [Helicoverpa armigera]|uniref:Uncharacterized protein n=1 Tax=Helicoverpa armigera TaxID=29058 RepID=A0A2W1BWK8_HELAM|nr:hypothetical protein B5X24_HaOG217281 [Helicoverpa armigera]
MKLDNSLTAENINQNLLNIKYAVRGPILERAIQIEREIQKCINGIGNMVQATRGQGSVESNLPTLRTVPRSPAFCIKGAESFMK